MLHRYVSKTYCRAPMFRNFLWCDATVTLNSELFRDAMLVLLAIKYGKVE
jgi:hypothetical protein